MLHILDLLSLFGFIVVHFCPWCLLPSQSLTRQKRVAKQPPSKPLCESCLKKLFDWTAPNNPFCFFCSQVRSRLELVLYCTVKEAHSNAWWPYQSMVCCVLPSNCHRIKELEYGISLMFRFYNNDKTTDDARRTCRTRARCVVVWFRRDLFSALHNMACRRRWL